MRDLRCAHPKGGLAIPWVSLLMLFALSACGGSGGSSPPQEAPAAPQFSVELVQVKTLRFTWASVPGAASYQVFENIDGVSGFNAVSERLSAQTNSYDLRIPLYARSGAAYTVTSCNAAGCTDSATQSISGSLIGGIGFFKASNSEAGIEFGESVALSDDGNTMVVGATGEDSVASGVNGNQDNQDSVNSGAVYVFQRDDNGWQQQAYIKADMPRDQRRFGCSVAVSGSGDTLAATTRDGFLGSEVTIFQRESGSWAQSFQFVNDVACPSISINRAGDVLAVSSSGGSSNSSSSVAIYGFDGVSWSEQASVEFIDAGELRLVSGSVVDLDASGDVLAISVPINSEVLVYERSDEVWVRTATLVASNIGNQSSFLPFAFGIALSISGDGDTLAVGASAEPGGASGINGDQGDTSATGAGAVYLYSRATGAWQQQAYIKASHPDAEDAFGSDVSLSADGNLLAITAIAEDGSAVGINGADSNTFPNTGAAYVFQRNSFEWVQQAYIKPGNNQLPARSPSFGSAFGSSISLSGDGATLAVGFVAEDSSASGINGSQLDSLAERSGAVYLY